MRIRAYGLGLLRSFFRKKDGAIAIIFALAVIPMFALMGAAVDYTHASAIRSDLQAALDATALMASKNAANLNQTQINSAAAAYFNALFVRKDAKTPSLTVTYSTTGGSTLTVAGNTSMATSFMSIMGISQIDISGTSTVAWGNSRLRVALVLDVTGSMASSGKMTALKTAAKNLLTQLKNAATADGDVYVSIIPFAKDVNVGSTNYTQSWISWTLWNAANGTCSKSSWRNSYNTQSDCQNAGGKWTAANHNTWNGCVTDRDQDYDTTNAAPTTSVASTLFPAEQYNACPVTLMGLSYDWTALSNKIDSLQPNGGTNQAIGLQWGFQSLTNAPFTIPAKDSNYTYNQVIILLSDGLNTQDRWYGDGTTHSTQVDARQQILCTNVKAAGITMYTVQVDTDGAPTSSVLQQCASSADKFFLLTTADQIVTTFDQIGTKLSALRIAK
ncbi:MAG TPA: pilus assembly protein [Xanthobacteraceae bacterium]|nr:pilus assembly protein [Xanthobacteraceae bacterium]